MRLLGVLNVAAPFVLVAGTSGLTAPVLSHPYSTPSSIRLTWTPATGGQGTVVYRVMVAGSVVAGSVTSPYDLTTALEQLRLYSVTVSATDDVTTLVSNAITGALEYDGTAAGDPITRTGALVSPFGSLVVYQGDTWTIAEGTGRLIEKPSQAVWPASLAGYTIVSRITRAAANTNTAGLATLDMPCTAVVLTGDSQSFYIESGTSTANLDLGEGTRGYDWEVVATKGSIQATLAGGTASVKKRL